MLVAVGTIDPDRAPREGDGGWWSKVGYPIIIACFCFEYYPNGTRIGETSTASVLLQNLSLSCSGQSPTDNRCFSNTPTKSINEACVIVAQKSTPNTAFFLEQPAGNFLFVFTTDRSALSEFRFWAVSTVAFNNKTGISVLLSERPTSASQAASQLYTCSRFYHADSLSAMKMIYYNTKSRMRITTYRTHLT